jgi:hypothetical protein
LGEEEKKPSPRTAYTPLPTTVVFETLRDLVYRVYDARCDVEREFQSLTEKFNARFPRTTLRLRVWPRKKGEQGFALYWIHIPARKVFFEHGVEQLVEAALKKLRKGSYRPTEERVRWFYRLKIKTSRDLDHAIHAGGLDHSRREVHEIHRQAMALNQAHKILTGVIDGLRKMLESRAGGKVEGFPAERFPDHLQLRAVPADVNRVLRLLWRLESWVDHRQIECRELTHTVRRKPLWQPYRLHFLEDPEHPYGRFVWIDDNTGRRHASLNYRVRKSLGLSERISRQVSPVEALSRKLDRPLRQSVALIRRIKLKVPAGLKQAAACLGKTSESKPAAPPKSGVMKECGT